MNKKTRIYNSDENHIFLGRNIKGRYARYKNVKVKLRRKLYSYNKGEIVLSSIINSIACYSGLIEQNVIKDKN